MQKVACMKLKVLFIIITACCLFHTPRVFAFTSQDNNYILHMWVETDDNQQKLPYNQPGSFVIQKPPVIVKPLPSPVPAPPQTSVQIGYSDTQQPQSEFKFSLADDSINFGPLSPTDFITRASGITVSGDPSYWYSILAYENHELESAQRQMIPNTTCDDGTCTDTKASPWTDTLTFGFGYQCENLEGADCEKSFRDSDMYKKFSVGAISQNGRTIMTGNTASEKKAKIYYKINVPGTQPQGEYQNMITYLAVPGY